MPLRILSRFFRFDAAGGLVLLAASVLAMILANTPLAPLYEQIQGIRIALRIETFEIAKPLLLWVNDGLMAVFFFLVGLEIKRETLTGALGDPRAAALPVIAALGGVAAPAAIYAAINWSDPTALHGWAVPTATDIAFALGMMSLLGNRVPDALKLLLTAIAIIDDLAAILIIAIFYTDGLAVSALVVAGLGLAALTALNRLGVRAFAPYILIGLVIWAAVLKSGVHATIAGVLIAFTIPAQAAPGETSPLERMEHGLHRWVAFLVLPVFGFMNAGVPLSGLGLGALAAPVSLGVWVGLVLGKQIGIFGAIALAERVGLARRPAEVSWMQIYGMAALCGIGFTMSLFIGGLAFHHTDAATLVRIGILFASLLATATGLTILALAGRGQRPAAPVPG